MKEIQSRDHRLLAGCRRNRPKRTDLNFVSVASFFLLPFFVSFCEPRKTFDMSSICCREKKTTHKNSRLPSKNLRNSRNSLSPRRKTRHKVEEAAESVTHHSSNFPEESADWKSAKESPCLGGIPPTIPRISDSRKNPFEASAD